MAAYVPSRTAGAAAPARRKLFLLFRIATDRYVLDAACVQQVLPLQSLKQMPGTPGWVAGMLSGLAQPVPVIDLSALAIGRPARSVTSTRIVLVDYRGDHLNAPRTLGLVLERATETIHRDPAAFVPSGLDNPGARYLGPVLNEAEGMVQWVSVEDLLPDTVQALLFPAEAEVRASDGGLSP
ncbi:MAG: chemotaxis protein CheW [Pseudomonadota bacterium]